MSMQVDSTQGYYTYTGLGKNSSLNQTSTRSAGYQKSSEPAYQMSNASTTQKDTFEVSPKARQMASESETNNAGGTEADQGI